MAGSAKVYTTGVFDLLHRGHLNILTQAAARGDLFVGVMTDKGVENSKSRRPILTLEERTAQLRSLPFVAGVIPYTDPDQRAVYASLQPEIVVQGDDWLYSDDRTPAIEYLRAHRIRLILLPRTEGISTTEIRKRVERSARRDERFLLENLSLVPIQKLRLFEQYEESKVVRLVEKISREQVFFNPISIVREMIVIDGVNRLEALRRLQVKHIPCVVFDYADLDLLGNVHFVKDGRKSRLSEFAREEGERIEFPQRSPKEIIAAADTGQMIPNGETFHRVPQSVIRLRIPLQDLRAEGGFDLPAFLRERIDAGEIRFFQSGVYVCDEW